jgi:hypothetical protein
MNSSGVASHQGLIGALGQAAINSGSRCRSRVISGFHLLR